VRTDAYDYHLPPGLIAQYPSNIRRKCRMLVLNRQDGAISHAQFEDLPGYLTRGDLLVFNNTKVIPARLLGRKSHTGGKVEVFLLRKITERRWEALVQPSGRCKPGTVVEIGASGAFRVVIGDYLGPGKREVRLICRGSVTAALEKSGHTPLPPYISRPDEKADARDYQTVFARRPGAVASPTASLHFDKVILNRLSQAGIGKTEVTLHVGEGSFRPIKTDTVAGHRIEDEQFLIPRRAIARLAAVRRKARRIVAVGTTVTRALETLAHWNPAPLESWDRPATRPGKTAGNSNLYITEPHNFSAVDALITNFHLPRSSLLVMVAAFTGRDVILNAYAEAIREKYRFYSYGDCMLIL